MVLFITQAPAGDWEESREVAELFQDAGVEGSFVLLDVLDQRVVGHNQGRSEEGFVPASTFKIPHTLIGLSVGAVRDVDEVLPYGGRPQPFKAWEEDMGLREAITLSSVPIYRELARRIGLERMRNHLSTLGYGNRDAGGDVERFWLEGPLRITAMEQARFLAKLARCELPYPRSHQESIQEIIRVEQGGDWTLHAKTGWENAPGPGVGWWVGWVRKGDRVYAFALNMQIRRESDAGKRTELGMASLKALGIL